MSLKFLNLLFLLFLCDVNLSKSKLIDNSYSSLISFVHFHETRLGTLIGYKKKVQNNTINAFYGLPYAEPPIGKLRFRRTKLIRKFPQSPYVAFSLKPNCPQKWTNKNAYRQQDAFSEDCLYLNLYTPNLNSKTCKETFNVMIYMNNEQFNLSGDLFASLHNTILVTINSRHSLFSSLYVEHTSMNGNLGLFDENLAIQWIKEYINEFCGDSERLTLFGSSSISIHLISKYSKHLIQNAIIQSESALFQSTLLPTKSELAINSFLAINELECIDFRNSKIFDNIYNLELNVITRFFHLSISGEYFLKQKLFLSELIKNSYNFESKLIVENDSIDYDVLELLRFLSKYAVDLDCLQNLPLQKIISLNESYTTDNWNYYYDFDFINIKSYLDYKLFNSLNLNASVNILIGHLSDEKCSCEITLKDKYYTDQFNAPLIPKEDAKELIKNSNILKTEFKEFTQFMADYYTNEAIFLLPRGYYDSYVNLISDLKFYCPSYFYSYFSALNANSVSSYVVNQKSTKHFNFNYDINTYSWINSCDKDELIYLFGLPMQSPISSQFTDLDRKFSLQLLGLWTTFAKTGEMPYQSNGKQWPISNKHHPKPKFVEINVNYIRERKFEFEERCESFWRSLLLLYKR